MPYHDLKGFNSLSSAHLAWVHSPTQADEALFSAIERLGRVSFLIAPNTLHYWWIPEWSARFPHAEVWGEKRVARGR